MKEKPVKKRDKPGVVLEQQVSKGASRSGKSASGGASTISSERLATVIAGAIVLAIVAGAGIILVSLGNRAVHYVVDTHRLFVEQIEVVGLKALSVDEVVALSGISMRTPILDVDLKTAALQILKHPRIAEAVVERHLPRKIVIVVKERVPIAKVLADGAIHGIDASGAVVPLISAREEIKGPIITGDIKNISSDAMKEALQAIDLMRPDIIVRISEVKIDPNGGITLLTTEYPVTIRLGRGEMDKKIERVRAAFKLFEQRGERKDYIDVRFQDMVTRP